MNASLTIVNALHRESIAGTCGLFCTCDTTVLLAALSVSCTLYVTNLQKPNTIAYFSNSCLLNIYNLFSQVYSLATFQPHMSIPFGVTVLQSSNNTKIDLYSKYWENK